MSYCDKKKEKGRGKWAKLCPVAPKLCKWSALQSL